MCIFYLSKVFFFYVLLQALHLVAQALLEEKTQLQGSNPEDVTFDFSLKAQSKISLFSLIRSP